MVNKIQNGTASLQSGKRAQERDSQRLDDLERFKEKMSNELQHAEKSRKDSLPDTGVPGDALLRSLQGAVQSSQPQTSANTNDLADLIQKIVKKVSVFANAQGPSEARLSVDSEILGKTDIRILRDGNDLKVQLVTLSAENSGQLKEGLMHALQKNLQGLTINIDVLTQRAGLDSLKTRPKVSKVAASDESVSDQEKELEWNNESKSRPLLW